MDRNPGWIRLLGAGASVVGIALALAHAPAPADPPSTVDQEQPLVALDVFTAASSEVARLRAHGQTAICLVRAGVWEPDRPDAQRFPPPVRGAPTADGTTWLDIRQWTALAEPLADRLGLCAAKDLVLVKLTDLDGWRQPTGFALTEDDQRQFLANLTELARARGLTLVG